MADPSLDIIMYTMIFPLGTVGFIAMLALFIYNELVMAPVKAYRKCKNKPHKVCALYLKSSGTAFMRSDAKYVAGAFEIENEKDEELLAFTKADKSSFKLGQAILEIIYDGANMTIAPEMLLAIEALKKKGYATIDDLVAAIQAKKFQSFQDDEVGINITLTKFPDDRQVYIPLMHSINPVSLVGYVLGSATILKSYSDTKVTMERLRTMKSGLANPNLQYFAMIIVFACLGLGMLKMMKVF